MIPRRPARLRRVKAQSINRLIPNIITLVALCSGLTAIRFALDGNWQAAVLAIIAAAVFDALDGRVARLIGATSKFGAELDSLSDFVCFGVVPGILMYLWALDDMGRTGWTVSLLYAVCMALRLARFNTALEDETRPPWTYNFFTGVPAPMAAALVLVPVVAEAEFGKVFLRDPKFVAVWMLVIGGLAISRIPTFAFKKVRIPNVWVLPILLAVGALAAGLTTEPWKTLLVIAVIYLVSIPFSIRAVAKLKAAAARSVTFNDLKDKEPDAD